MLEQKMTDKINENLSRRNFLVKAGALTAGMAVAGSLFGSAKKAEAAELLTADFPYAKLDPDAVRETGFNNYFVGGCMYGAAHALIHHIREAVGPGTKWDNINTKMFLYGAGGANAWGTLCGALNGAQFVIAMAAGAANAGGIGNDLMGWYAKFPHPTTKLDHLEAPVGKDADGNTIYGTFAKQIQTVSNSPLCHNSVSRWCQASGKSAGSYEKKHRCAKLTGETAAKAAELLNQLVAYNDFRPANTFKPETDFCMGCHIGHNEVGKLDCNDCHDGRHDHSAFSNPNDCSACHD